MGYTFVVSTEPRAYRSLGTAKKQRLRNIAATQKDAVCRPLYNQICNLCTAYLRNETSKTIDKEWWLLNVRQSKSIRQFLNQLDRLERFYKAIDEYSLYNLAEAFYPPQEQEGDKIAPGTIFKVMGTISKLNSIAFDLSSGSGLRGRTKNETEITLMDETLSLWDELTDLPVNRSEKNGIIPFYDECIRGMTLTVTGKRSIGADMTPDGLGANVSNTILIQDYAKFLRSELITAVRKYMAEQQNSAAPSAAGEGIKR